MRSFLRSLPLLALTVLAPLLAGAAGSVTAPIDALDQGLLRVMQAGKATPFPQRYQMLAPVVQSAFDLPQVLQTTVGLSYASMPAAQQSQLLAEFTQYTIASYVANFDSYNGQRFEVNPTPKTVGTDEVVTTSLVPKSGSPTRIDYVMRNVGGQWKIVDVLLDGTISQDATHRSDFRSSLSSGGAPALVAMLQKKVSQLSGGTMQ